MEQACLDRDGEGDPTSISLKYPRKLKMRRLAATGGEGGDVEWEEYFDYHFPDDEKNIGEISGQGGRRRGGDIIRLLKIKRYYILCI